MPRNRKAFIMNDFSGGLNDKYNPFSLPPGEFTTLTNWHLNNRGQLIKRSGSARLLTETLSGAPAIQGLAQIRTRWELRRLVVIAGGKVYYQEEGEDSFTDVTGNITLTSGQDVVAKMVQAFGAVVGVNGTDAPWKWSYQPTQYTSLPDTYAILGTSSGGTNCHLAQGIKVDYAETVDKVGLKLTRLGQPGGKIHVAMASDSGGYPHAHLGWSTGLDCATLPTSSDEWTWFDLPTTSGLSQIDGATQYHILLHTTGYTKDFDSLEVRLHLDQSSPGYPNGSVATTATRAWNTGWSAYSPVSDAPFQIRTIAKALGGSPPTKVKAIAFYRNVLFLGNGEADGIPYPSRLWWSDLGDLETWPSNNNNDFNPHDGAEITALHTLGEHLIVFKDNSIHRCTLEYVGVGGLSGAFHFQALSTEYGCVGPNAIVSTGDALYFMDRRGLCRLGLDLVPRYVGEKIETFWNNINNDRLPYVYVGHDRLKSQLWFSVSYGSGQTSNNRIIVYNYLRRAFTIYEGIYANAIHSYRDDEDKRWLITGTYDGLILKQDTGFEDDGVGYEATAITGHMDLGNPQLYKLFEQIAIEGTSDGDSVLYFTANINRGDLSFSDHIPADTTGGFIVGTAIIGTATIGPGTTSSFTYGFTALRGRGRRIQLTLLSKAASHPPTVGVISLFYKPLAIRG